MEGKYTEAELLGCYPLPNPLHNMHLIKAMREFFTQENPEFLKHIGKFYRTPWFRPAIAFCNSFSFIRFPVSSRKKINRAIAEQKAFWNYAFLQTTDGTLMPKLSKNNKNLMNNWLQKA